MLGENLKKKRVEKGLSQDAFAKRLSVVRQTVSKWEKGLSVPDSKMLLLIAAVLETSVGELLDEHTVSKSLTQKSNRSLKTFEIVLLVLGSPIWLSLAVAAVAVIFSLCISLWAAFASFIGCALGGIAAGIVFTCNGNILTGIAIIGAGILLSGLSIFMFFGSKAATKGILILTKKLVLWIKNCFVKKEEA